MNIYQFLGYHRVKGDGKKGAYDFVEVYVAEKKEIGENDGGYRPHTTYKSGKGLSYPCISYDNFRACSADGLKVLGKVSFYRDNDRRLCMKVEK